MRCQTACQVGYLAGLSGDTDNMRDEHGKFKLPWPMFGMRQALGCRHNKIFIKKVNYNNKNPNFLDTVKIVSPIKNYSNAEEMKTEALKDNKGKSGIYRWINKINGNTYVGSAVNLKKRLGNYYNMKELTRNPRPITDALLKYGHKNFILEILEYCDSTNFIEREQFYLDLLIPEYNILKYAYSVLGYKHTQETIEKLKEKIISPEHKMLLSSIKINKLVRKLEKN